MLFHLFFEWKDVFTPLNVFRYPSFRVLVAMLTALSVTYFLYPWFIRRLKERQIGQVIREELEDQHGQKAKTPTMGGILLVIAVLVSSLLWSDLRNPLVWGALLVMLGLAIVGFIDDAMKLGPRGVRGLSARGKLVLQFGISGLVFAGLLYGSDAMDSTLYLPFVAPERFHWVLPAWLYVTFGAFVVAGTSNAVNLTDGLDGLAIGPVIVAAGTLGLLAYASATILGYSTEIDGQTVWTSFHMAHYLKLPQVPGAQELAIFCAAIVGAGIGFLWYNAPPAQIFMGDVGSLALGGALGVVAVLTKNEFLSVIILGLFVVEIFSVMIQVAYFKATGKRILLMAPIHHHFQKKGWAEPLIVIRFWILSILLSLAALASLKLR